MRSLVAEDDVTSRILLQSFLSEYGECHIAGNGREAVAAFRDAQERAQAYDLICMDIMMPEVDGQTALREIRAFEDAQGKPPTGRVKVIMTTALNDSKNVIEAMQGSCDAYMLKPIHKKELLDHLKNLHLV